MVALVVVLTAIVIFIASLGYLDHRAKRRGRPFGISPSAIRDANRDARVVEAGGMGTKDLSWTAAARRGAEVAEGADRPFGRREAVNRRHGLQRRSIRRRNSRAR